MEEVKNSFFLSNEAYEHFLIIARERYVKSRQLHAEAIAIKDSQPLQAVKLFYKAHELSCFSSSEDELFNSKAPLSSSAEILDKESTAEDLFYRGLQAKSGTGRDCNNVTALQYFHLAAEKDFAPAQRKIGTAYFHGKIVIQDFFEALKWFRRAAKQGDSFAQHAIGCMYSNGHGVPQDYAEAMKWFYLGAKQANPLAQYAVGTMYEKGNGVIQTYAEAFKWYYLAAEQGFSSAQHALAGKYFQGLGINQDYAKALKWVHLAAEQKHGEACYDLGSMYYNSNGVEENDTEAMKWFHLAAEQEHPRAQYALGIMYFNSSPSNQREAMKWFRRAAKQGVRYPQGNYRGIRSLLFSYKPTIDDFQTHYDFAMMNHDSPALQEICTRDPNLFCETLQNDTLLTIDERYEWILYLCAHHFLQLSLDLQLSVTESIYFHGAIPKETATRLIKALKHFPEDKERYVDALRLLWNLSQVVDPKGYLSEYFLRKYLEKKPEDKYLYEKNSWITWDELSLEYCNAEIKLTSEKFKLWIETQVKDLESSNNPLSTSELNLLHEFYYRRAQLEYETARALKNARTLSVFSQLSSFWWSTPESIQITPAINLLKNISPEHRRFDEAQFLLHECHEHFKESFQTVTNPDIFALNPKYGKGKQD